MLTSTPVTLVHGRHNIGVIVGAYPCQVRRDGDDGAAGRKARVARRSPVKKPASDALGGSPGGVGAERIVLDQILSQARKLFNDNQSP